MFEFRINNGELEVRKYKTSIKDHAEIGSFISYDGPKGLGGNAFTSWETIGRVNTKDKMEIWFTKPSVKIIPVIGEEIDYSNYITEKDKEIIRITLEEYQDVLKFDEPVQGFLEGIFEVSVGAQNYSYGLKENIIKTSDRIEKTYGELLSLVDKAVPDSIMANHIRSCLDDIHTAIQGINPHNKQPLIEAGE